MGRFGKPIGGSRVWCAAVAYRRTFSEVNDSQTTVVRLLPQRLGVSFRRRSAVWAEFSARFALVVVALSLSSPEMKFLYGAVSSLPN